MVWVPGTLIVTTVPLAGPSVKDGPWQVKVIGVYNESTPIKRLGVAQVILNEPDWLVTEKMGDWAVNFVIITNRAIWVSNLVMPD
jgi:hypothetical protein